MLQNTASLYTTNEASWGGNETKKEKSFAIATKRKKKTPGNKVNKRCERPIY